LSGIGPITIKAGNGAQISGTRVIVGFAPEFSVYGVFWSAADCKGAGG
jgi:hypothetical protein